MPLYRKKMMKNPDTSANPNHPAEHQQNSRKFKTIERPSYQIKTEQELRQDVLSMSESSNRTPIAPMTQMQKEVPNDIKVANLTKELLHLKKPETEQLGTGSQHTLKSEKKSLPKLEIRDAPTPSGTVAVDQSTLYRLQTEQ